MTSEPLRCVALESVELECCAAGCEPNAHMTKCGGILIETEGPCQYYRKHYPCNLLRDAATHQDLERAGPRLHTYVAPLTHAEPADHEPKLEVSR